MGIASSYLRPLPAAKRRRLNPTTTDAADLLEDMRRNGPRLRSRVLCGIPREVDMTALATRIHREENDIDSARRSFVCVQHDKRTKTDSFVDLDLTRQIRTEHKIETDATSRTNVHVTRDGRVWAHSGWGDVGEEKRVPWYLCVIGRSNDHENEPHHAPPHEYLTTETGFRGVTLAGAIQPGMHEFLRPDMTCARFVHRLSKAKTAETNPEQRRSLVAHYELHKSDYQEPVHFSQVVALTSERRAFFMRGFVHRFEMDDCVLEMKFIDSAENVKTTEVRKHKLGVGHPSLHSLPCELVLVSATIGCKERGFVHLWDPSRRQIMRLLSADQMKDIETKELGVMAKEQVIQSIWLDEFQQRLVFFARTPGPLLQSPIWEMKLHPALFKTKKDYNGAFAGRVQACTPLALVLCDVVAEYLLEPYSSVCFDAVRAREHVNNNSRTSVSDWTFFRFD